jgi:phosphonate transport system substrate-binding protein
VRRREFVRLVAGALLGAGVRRLWAASGEGASAAKNAGAPRRRLALGLVPEVNIFKQKERFQALGEYLGQRTGVEIDFVATTRYGEFIPGLVSGRMDGTVAGSLAGAVAIERLNAVPLARPVELDGSSTYRGLLLVRKDGPFRQLTDLRGKTIAFVDRLTTAYLLSLALLRRAGLQGPESFFGESFFTGSHDAAIRAVLRGEADAACAKSTILESLRREDPAAAQNLRVLAESAAVPSNTWLMRSATPAAVSASLKSALLGLEDEAAGSEALRRFGALRFVEARAEDYRPVFELAREAGVDLGRYELGTP